MTTQQYSALESEYRIVANYFIAQGLDLSQFSVKDVVDVVKANMRRQTDVQRRGNIKRLVKERIENQNPTI